MKISKKWIIRNYIEFNKKYFDNSLPFVRFFINNSKTMYGYAYFLYDENNNIKPYSITMSNYFDESEYENKNTLLHEMIHIYEYITFPKRFAWPKAKTYNAHGMFFEMKAALINKDGWHIVKTV